MKIVVIGDIHGRTIWKRIVDNNQDATKIVFIGDYVDSFDISGIEQLDNLQEIIKFKTDNPDKVVLLVGNHDYQYWPGSPDIGNYSGYQPTMYYSFYQLFNDNRKLFQMVYVDNYDNWYSHAGFTKTWVEKAIGNLDAEQINRVFEYSPRSFKFYENDRSGCGDSIYQSCIWVRPDSLYKDGINKTQIIGHTQITKIDLGKSVRRNYYMIDAIQYGEYLIIEDGIFKVGKI